MTVLATLAKCLPPCALQKTFSRVLPTFTNVGGSKQFRLPAALGGLALCATITCAVSQAQSLEVTYGGRGVQTLRYGGVTLMDTNAHPEDTFHIWHMKCSDANGSSLTTGQYGWGENNSGTQWDASTRTETYRFQWGQVRTQFVQNGDRLDVVVTETNNADSGVIFDGAEVYALTMRFPQDPRGFNGQTQYAITTTQPGVNEADFGSGKVTTVIPDESVPMYGGWKNTGWQTYSPMMTTTTPDAIATFLPHMDRAVKPGESLTYTVSLRFTPAGTYADANDAYASFAKTYPSQINWTDHRILGTAYLASSPQNATDKTQPGGFPRNPRRYFNDSSVDVISQTGLQSFQNRMLAVARDNVTNAQKMNGQGVITWDLEGEQYPMDTSYVCSPDQIAAIAPEMESTVLDPSSPYRGQKLDDAYFKTMTDAGLKVGVCVRPQQFVLSGDGRASQNYLSTNQQVIANLENKIRYANSRWGVSVFYVDSSVDVNGGTLDPAIFQQLSTDFPNVLLIPEESTPRYYAYTAPFASFLFHGDLGTPVWTYNFYPNAFSANLVNDVSASNLATYAPQLTQSVGKGDILMGITHFWQANDPTLVQIYTASGRTTAAPARVTPVAPTIQWATPAAISYGTALSGAQLNATANVPGTFAYSPAAGAVPAAGTQVLQATFTPADTKKYTVATASMALTVNAIVQTAPKLMWATPAAISYGTALSGAQLNATANVPGTFVYSPAAGTVPAAGTQTLQVTFTPSDTKRYTAATASVALTVNPVVQATPVLTWNVPGLLASGTTLSAGVLNATANVPGRFTYSPAAGTVLSTGVRTLQVTFTPTDTVRYRSVSKSVVVMVWGQIAKK